MFTLLKAHLWCFMDKLCGVIGGNGVRGFYCETEGCVNDVKRVYCEDVELLGNKEISNCSHSPLPPNTICQHRGRLFVSTSLKSCEFEGVTGYIETKNCTGIFNANIFILFSHLALSSLANSILVCEMLQLTSCLILLKMAHACVSNFPYMYMYMSVMTHKNDLKKFPYIIWKPLCLIYVGSLSSLHLWCLVRSKIPGTFLISSNWCCSCY